MNPLLEQTKQSGTNNTVERGQVCSFSMHLCTLPSRLFGLPVEWIGEDVRQYWGCYIILVYEMVFLLFPGAFHWQEAVLMWELIIKFHSWCNYWHFSVIFIATTLDTFKENCLSFICYVKKRRCQFVITSSWLCSFKLRNTSTVRTIADGIKLIVCSLHPEISSKYQTVQWRIFRANNSAENFWRKVFDLKKIT